MYSTFKVSSRKRKQPRKKQFKNLYRFVILRTFAVCVQYYQQPVQFIKAGWDLYSAEV